jgi:twitching motility protein PilT
VPFERRVKRGYRPVDPGAMPETTARPFDRSRVEEILRSALSLGASDLHFKAGERILLRIRGDLRALDVPRLTPAQTQAVFDSIRPARLAGVDVESIHEIDFSFAVPGAARFRANAFRQRGSLALVVRVIPIQIPDLQDLGLPEVVADLAAEERGIVLVTGATGSGKSTTLAAMIKHINRTRAAHVITIEDPIEFLFLNERSSIVQREVGSDTGAFADALRAALRQDPDVIMIGEMRDAETMDIAIKAAETGHLVLSTAHTTDAAKTIHRLVGAASPSEQGMLRLRLSEALRAVISMRLLPRADGQGLVPAIEVMVNTRIVQDCIRQADRQGEIPEIISKGAHYGMRTFDQDLLRLVREGTISREVALAAATSPGDLDLQLRLGQGEEEQIELAERPPSYSDELAAIDPALRIEAIEGLDEAKPPAA